MSSPNPLDYIFCPYCARYLETKIEEERARRYCRECEWTYYPAPHIAVAGIAIRENLSDLPGVYYETLMVQRKKKPIGKWSFPAGFVDFGEHPDYALIREVREETGLTVVRFKLITEVVSDDDPRSPKQFARFYQIVVTGEIKNGDTEENSAIEWLRLSSSNPLDIAWGNHKILFERMKEHPGAFNDLMMSCHPTEKGEKQ